MKATRPKMTGPQNEKVKGRSKDLLKPLLTLFGAGSLAWLAASPDAERTIRWAIAHLRFRDQPVVPPQTQRFTVEMRQRGIAHVNEMIAHINVPNPDGEPDWDVDELFPADRVR